MHMSDSKDETLFFDQILLLQLLQCVLASQQFFVIGIYDKESRTFTNNRGSLASTRSF